MKTLPASLPSGAGLGLVLALFSACAVGPDFVRPPLPAADRYTRVPLPPATAAASGHAQQFGADSPLVSDWWRLFRCEPLDAAVRASLVNNPTLQAAEASLEQSQDELRAGEGVFYPRLDAALDASRQRSAPVQQGQAAPGTIFSLLTLSGTISYPLDVFGGERRAVEGLRAQADNQRYLALAAGLTLSANVVDACIARAAYSAEIRATEQLLALEDEQLRLTADQVRAGTAPYAGLLAVRGAIAANQALLAPLKQRVAQAADLLAALEGAFPEKADLPEIDLEGLALPVALPLSLPSDLVRQRPDILSAEAQLRLASANIGVATAALFPSISLSGTYGAASTSFSHLSAASARFWSVGPSVTVPLFQGGSLWFGRKAAIAADQQAQALYRQTVLNAFAQVADSLQALEHDAEALQAQDAARDAAAETLGLLQANYRAGLVAYPDVLAADVLLHEATIADLQAVAQRHQDTVALLVAFGGGWWNGPDAAGADGAP